MFLTEEQMADLTGVRKGQNGGSRYELQCEHLCRVGVPFHPGAPRFYLV